MGHVEGTSSCRLVNSPVVGRDYNYWPMQARSLAGSSPSTRPRSDRIAVASVARLLRVQLASGFRFISGFASVTIAEPFVFFLLWMVLSPLMHRGIVHVVKCSPASDSSTPKQCGKVCKNQPVVRSPRKEKNWTVVCGGATRTGVERNVWPDTDDAQPVSAILVPFRVTELGCAFFCR